MSDVIGSAKAVTLNLFGEVEVWNSIDDYLDGFPSSRVYVDDGSEFFETLKRSVVGVSDDVELLQISG